MVQKFMQFKTATLPPNGTFVYLNIFNDVYPMVHPALSIVFGIYNAIGLFPQADRLKAGGTINSVD